MTRFNYGAGTIIIIGILICWGSICVTAQEDAVQPKELRATPVDEP